MKLLKYGLAITLLFAFTVANANSVLESTFPKGGQQLKSAPEQLKFKFNKPVKLTQLEIYKQSGEQVTMAFMLSPKASELFEIPLQKLSQNSYKVKWQAINKDSTKIKGEFSFNIKPATSVLSNKKKHKLGHNKIPNKFFVNHDSAPGKVVTQFHKALKTGNKQLARSLLDDNVLIYEGGGVERSAEQYANHHMLSDMKYLKNIKSKLLEHIVLINGKTAISNARSLSKGQYKGKAVNRTGMETIVLRKIKGSWKIVRIHWS